MRYFLTLSYLGTEYVGWQRQPGAMSVQEKIETSLSTILRRPIEITGCGRTDAGVHARDYVAHFDFGGDLPPTFVNGANALLPPDIAIHDFFAVRDEAHARYDAYERGYEYRISLRKDPFARQTAWFFPQSKLLSLEKLQSVADLLPAYHAFAPFCKTHSGLDSFACELKSAVWQKDEAAHELVFRISANRFLRGMVRLIVGACVNVSLGKTTLDAVKKSLDEQSAMPKSFSVPPQGLCLTMVKYDYGKIFGQETQAQ